MFRNDSWGDLGICRQCKLCVHALFRRFCSTSHPDLLLLLSSSRTDQLHGRRQRPFAYLVYPPFVM